MEYTPKTKEWFIERIGKRIFRDGTGKICCDTCRDVEDNGLVIADKNHADYLSTLDTEFAIEGTFMNYRDKK